MNSSSRPHILIMDDASAILELLGEVLIEDGYRVTTSPKLLGDDELAELAPDLIVLDLIFNERVTGLEWLDRLRRDPRRSQVPVVLCTAAVEMVRDLPVEHAAGSVGIVLKPFDLDHLLGQVSAHLHEPTLTS